MKQPVLFVHGAGPDAYQEDGALAASLRAALGAGYDVRYPAMLNAGEPTYEGWRDQIAAELATFDAPPIMVGHSLGGSVLLKYLAEAPTAAPVAGVFLVAVPFWNADPDWQVDEYALANDFAAQLTSIPRIVLYHSRDDDTVPFAHAERYAVALPQATLRAFDRRGHQFNDDLREIADDIRNNSGSEERLKDESG